MKTTHLTPSELISELVAEVVRGSVGAIGVIVRDVPAPDPGQLLDKLMSLREEGLDLRIAYLLSGGKAAADERGIAPEIFSAEVEQAERWRNERDLEALIVVVAHGNEAKLSSLEEFTAITSRDLKRILVERALGGEAGQNDVQERWWAMLGKDNGIGLGQLIDYYLALSGKEGADFLKASSREVFRLGLLSDASLFDDPKESAVRKRVKDNRELISRFQTLTPKDRRAIMQRIQSEEDPEDKKRLREALDQLDRTRWEGEGMRAIDLEAAGRLVKARTKKPNNGGDKPRPSSEKVVDVAAEALVNEERENDLETIVDGLGEYLNTLEELRLRPETVKTQLSDSGSEAVASARLDVINLMSRLLDEGVYGGLVEIETPDIGDILRRFNDQQHVVERWERKRIAEFLGQLSVHESGARLAAKFDAYDEAREEVLPLMRSLAAEPLVVAANPDTRAKLLNLIEAYEEMSRTALKQYESLFSVFGPDAHEVLGYLLLLETVIIRARGQTYAIPSPIHPLFLWHYARYSQIVDEQRERLEEKDKALVIQAAKDLPNFMTSMFVPPAAFGEGASLPFLGHLGPLPYFGKQIEVDASDDGLESIRKIVEAHLTLEPHSRMGFRLALVDPPDAGVYLSLLADLAEEGSLSGAHLSVYRHPRQKLGIELRLDEDEEDRVARVFRSLSPDRRFTFEVHELSDQEIGPPEDGLFHVVVIFDQGSGRLNSAGPALHPIQPLALPRNIRYSIVHQTVELEPASGGPFHVHDQLGKHLGGHGGGSSFLAIHQEKELREAFEGIASRIPWIVIAGRHVDRDLAIGSLRVFTGRDGGRDVAAFSRSPAAFRRPLRDVVRNYNAFVSKEELDDLLEQLSGLLDAGLLSLLPDALGNTNFNMVKGLLGTLIAVRWLRQSSSDRLLISLDGTDARRWLHLSDEPLRADLIAFEWTNDHCTVSVIEVKAVQPSSGEYTVTDKIVDGPAIQQMLATRRLLSSVFASERGNELITTPARREVLREHLYRELTKGTYSPEERKLWADRLQRLLDGRVTAYLRCHLVDVRLGVDASTLQNRNVSAKEGETMVPVQITQLNHEPLDALVQKEAAETPERESPPEEEDERSEAEIIERSTTETPPEPPEQRHEPTTPRDDTVKAEPPHAAESRTERVRAYLGTSSGAYGKPMEVWFDPASPGNQLPNPHLSITGETGSGKTQATKAIVKEFRQYGIPALIMDFKDDYSELAYAEAEGMQVYDPSYASLPFNPLAPAVDPRAGRVNSTYHIHQLAEIIKRIYRLGDQQAYRLREALKRAYEAASIPMRSFEPSPEQKYPPFEAVRSQLETEKGNEGLLGRLSPIFDLGLFASEGEADFADVVASSTVVRLGQLPGDEIKNSVAEFFLMALYNYLIRQRQVHSLSRLLILDEAWRLVESPFLEPLVREGRAFGLCVLIATQFPNDLPEEVSGSTATKLFFSQTQLNQIRKIQQTVVGKTSGSDADHIAGVMKGLSPLTCVLHNKQHSPFVRATIKPYFER